MNIEENDQFKIYQSGENFYKIDLQQVDAFKQSKPDAREVSGFSVGDKSYDAKKIAQIGKVSDFVAQKPGAKPIYVEGEIKVQSKTPATSKQNVAQTTTPVKTQAVIQPALTPEAPKKKIVPAVDLKSIELYENTQKLYADRDNDLRVFNENYESKSRFQTTMPMGMGGGGASLYLKNDEAVLSARKTALMADLKAAKSKSDPARLELQQKLEKAIQGEIKNNGIEVFRKTNSSGDRVVSPDAISAWSRSVIRANGGRENGYAQEFLKVLTTSAVNAYESSKKAEEAAQKFIKQKYGQIQDQLLTEGEKIKSNASVASKTLSTSLLQQAKNESEQLMAPIKDAFKVAGEKNTEINSTFQKAQDAIQYSYNSGAIDANAANAALQDLQKQYQQQYAELTSTFDALNAKVLEVESGINNKYKARYERQAAEIQNAANARLGQISEELKKIGVGEDVINDYKAAWKKAFDANEKARNAKLMKDARVEFTGKSMFIRSLMPFSGPVADWVAAVPNFAETFVNGLGSDIQRISSFFQWEAGQTFGADLANSYTKPQFNIESWKDLTDPLLVSGSGGLTIGGMAPMLLTQTLAGLATGGMSVPAQMALQGSISFTMETMSMAGGMYDDVFSQTGDAAKANKAANTIIQDQLNTFYLYTLDGLPFINKATLGIKGRGFLPSVARATGKGLTETLTEIPQEFVQGGSEERIMETMKNDNGEEVSISKFIDIFNNKPYLDFNGKVVTPRERLESTALNVIPATVLTGGSGEIMQYGSNAAKSAMGRIAAMKSSLSEISPSFHNQYVLDIYLNKGVSFASGYVRQLMASGLMTKPQYESLISNFETLESVQSLYNSKKITKDQARVMTALSVSMNEEKASLESATNEIEREVAQQRYNSAKAKFDAFVKTGQGDYVIIDMPNSERYIASYEQFEEMLSNQDFVDAARSNINISVVGSQKTSSDTNLIDIAKLKLNLNEQGEYDPNIQPSREIANIFSATEIPYANQHIQDLEIRMQNAEEIPMSEINTALENLYSQLTTIFDKFYGTESGKAAAKIISDTIDKLKSYEFATDKETEVIAETATVQTARKAVESDFGIIQSVNGEGRTGKPRRNATVTLEDGTTGQYSISITNGQVTLDPTRGEPIRLGDVRSVNESAGFVEMSMGKNGMPSSVTFTIQGIGAERGRKTITLNTAQGYTQEELLDILIDLRAKELGTVDPEAFDLAFNEVSRETKETTVYPNIQRQDAVQEQATGQVPVQPETGTRQEMAEGKPETKPEAPAETRKQEGKIKAGKPILDAIKNVQSALRSLGVEVVLIEDPAEYDKISQAIGQKTETEGLFIGKDGKIYLNAKYATDPITGRTIIFHEGAHPIMNLIRNTNPKLYNKILTQIKAMKGRPGMADVFNFANNEEYRKKGQWAVDDELVVETIARLADGSLDAKMFTPSLRENILDFINKIASMLGLPQIKSIGSVEAKKAIRQVANALRYGGDITKTFGTGSILAPGDVQQRAVGVFNGVLEKLGINVGKVNPKTGKTKVTNFDIAKALSEYYKKEYKKIRIGDFGKKAIDTVSDYAFDEIVFAINTFGNDSGMGWYTKDFAKAIETLKNFDKDISDNPEIRSVATAIIAIASNSTDVYSNLLRVVYGVNEYKNSGKVPLDVGIGAGQSAIASSIQTYNNLLELFGDPISLNEFMSVERTIPEARKALMEKAGVKTIKELRDKGIYAEPGWNDNEILPTSIILFGPKIGAFWSNLSGLGGTPTVDRWCIRTIYRYMGDMRAKALPRDIDSFAKANGLEGQSKGSVASVIESHAKMFNMILTGRGEFSGQTKQERNERLKKYRAGSTLWKSMSNIVSEITDGITEKIDNAAQYEKDFRSFTKNAFVETQKKLKERLNMDLEISDIQAILWIYEKNLFGFMGVKQRKDSTYSAASNTLLSKMNSGEFTLDQLKSGKVKSEENVVPEDGAMGDVYGVKQKDFSSGVEGQSNRLDVPLKQASVAGARNIPSREEFNTNASEAIERLKAATGEDGATLNLDGTTYTGGGLVVPTASENLSQGLISTDGLYDFMVANQGKISNDTFKIGLYRFKDKEEVSYDLNIVIPNEYRDVALEFGRFAGQESLFDLDTFENIKTGATGTNPLTFQDAEYASIAQDLSQGKLPSVAQPSVAGARDLVSGTYYEPDMTTDSSGNYVFFHVSSAPEKSILKGIDSRKFQSLRTSREEKGLQYGIASFYTKPTDGERMVGGDKYYVTVKPEDVYPMDTDPNGYRAAAEKKVKPGTPFREEKVKKAMAEAAAKDGYQMAVGEWAYSRSGKKTVSTPNFRGDALVKLIPKVYTGDESFTTGEERGVTTQYPNQEYYAAKERLDEIASDIQSSKSKKNKYDDAYQVANSVSSFGGIIENYAEENEFIRDLTPEEFDMMYQGATASQKKALDEVRENYLKVVPLPGQASVAGARDQQEPGKKKYRVFISFKSKYGRGSYGKTYEFNDKRHFDNWLNKYGSKLNYDEVFEPKDDVQTSLAGIRSINWERSLEGKGDPSISSRNPVVVKAAQDLKAGKITNEEHRATVHMNSPILPIIRFFEPATLQEIKNAFTNSTKKASEAENIDKPIQDGEKVGLRLDIPSYKYNNTWVVSVHKGHTKNGPILSYLNVAKIKNVFFEPVPSAALNIATGEVSKVSVARMYGEWENIPGDTMEQRGENAKDIIQSIINDPNYVQVGMNPFRHSYFYDRSSDIGRPVVSADEVIQIGGLVYAKNPVYGNWTDEAYRVKDLLDSSGMPVQFSIAGSRSNAPTIAAGGPTPTNVRRRGGISAPGLRRVFAGPAESDLRESIMKDNRSFYSPISWSKIKDKVDQMTELELIDLMDTSDPQNIYDNIVIMGGPSAPIAFVKYFQLMRQKRDQALVAGRTDEAENIEADIKEKFLDIKSLGTVAAQVLSMFRVLKSTRNDAEFHTDIIEAMIDTGGGMLSKEQRTTLLGFVQDALNAHNFYQDTIDIVYKNQTGATESDLADLSIAEMWRADASMALNIHISNLVQDRYDEIFGSAIKGHLLGVSSMIVSGLSNMLNLPNRSLEKAGQRQIIRITNLISKLSGKGQYFGQGVQTAYGKPIGRKISGIIDSLKRLLSSMKEFVKNPFKYVYNKLTYVRTQIKDRPNGRNMLASTADIIVYGNRDLNERLYGTAGQLNPWTSMMRVLGKNKKPVGDFRSMIKDIRQSFKKTDFVQWLSEVRGMSFEDYTALGNKDKVDLREQFFQDKLSVQPVTRSTVKDIAKAASAAAEFNFRIISLTDYIPRTLAEQSMLESIAESLGLDGVDKALFKHDPYAYIQNRNNLVSKEVLDYWNEYASELTLTKKTFLGSASVEAANVAKYGVRKLVRKAGIQDTKIGDTVETISSLAADTLMPFVKLPMNATSYALDYMWPWKSWAKAGFFFDAAKRAKQEAKSPDAYELSATKYLARGFVGLAYSYIAMTLITVPGLIAIGSGEDDDDEERRINKDMPRNRLNASAFARYIKGLAGIGDGDTSFQKGDKTIDLLPLGVLGLMTYAYGNAYKKQRSKYLNQKYDPDLLNRPIGENKTLQDTEWSGNEDPDIFTAMKLQSKVLGYYFDQAWFMGITNWVKALTAEGEDAEYLLNKAKTDMVGTALATSVMFSNYAKKTSDVSAQMAGKPLPDVNMSKVKQYETEIYNSRMYRAMASRNGLVDFISGVDPYEDQYLSFAMFGQYAMPLKGAPRDLPGTIWALNTPTREVVGDWSDMQRYYVSIYGQRNQLKLKGNYSMDLREPYMGMTESMIIPAKGIMESEYSGKFQVPAKDYNELNHMSGRIREKLYNVLMDKWMNTEINGVKISPEDIENPKTSNTKEVMEAKKGMAVAISEANRITKDFLRPWTLLKDADGIVAFTQLNAAQKIQKIRSLVNSYTIEYSEYNPDKDTPVQVYTFLSNPEIQKDLVDLAYRSIDMYVTQLEKAKLNYLEIQQIQQDEEVNVKDLMKYMKE